MLMHNSPETDGSNSQGNKIAANFQSRSKFLRAASAGFNNLFKYTTTKPRYSASKSTEGSYITSLFISIKQFVICQKYYSDLS